MASVAQTRSATHLPGVSAWLPLVVVPTGAVVIGGRWPAWVWMWSLAVAVYGGLKWLTLTASAEAEHASAPRKLGYLLLWAGMDADAFLSSHRRVPRPLATQWLWAVGKTLFGLWL